jgi:hypothetical protein
VASLKTLSCYLYLNLDTMKYAVFLLLISFVLASCTTKNHEGHNHGHHAASANSDSLYNKVMGVHDEVMPKLNDLYTLKEELKKQLANVPALTDDKRKELEAKIASIEAASEGMMRWMREFSPPADSLGEETMRLYLEEEMEKVKKVRDDITTVLK